MKVFVFYLIYWLLWIFVAARRLSLIAVLGLLFAVALQGDLGLAGFSSYGTQT